MVTPEVVVKLLDFRLAAVPDRDVPVSGPGANAVDSSTLTMAAGKVVDRRSDIWASPLFGERKPYLLLNFPASEELARFSPYGHWLAYTSRESGSPAVYVRSFTSEGRVGSHRKRYRPPWRLSEPIWRRDGAELFYLSPADEIMSVAVKRSPAGPELGLPKALFQTRTLTGGHTPGNL